MAKHTAAEKAEYRASAIQRLARWLPEGTVVSVLTDRVGEARHLKLFACVNGEADDITDVVADAIEARYNDRRRTIVVSGHGFSAPQEVVSRLSHAIGHELKYVMR